jgi:hypothetical protein
MARYSRKAFLWFLILNLLFSGHAFGWTNGVVLVFLADNAVD